MQMKNANMYVYDYDDVSISSAENTIISSRVVEEENGVLASNLEMENSVLPMAQVNYKQLNVIKNYQERSNWCWVACAKMLGKYYTGTLVN